MLLITAPFLFMVLFLIVIFTISGSRSSLKKTTDLIKLKLPIIGSVSVIQSSLNTMFSLEVLTSSGYPVESALKESSHVLSNSALKDAILRIRKAIISGEKLSEAFSREKLFPPRIGVWIGVGEASGDVTKVFSQLRNYLQGEIDKKTSRIMILIEPALIVFVGIIMILFVILFVVPLFSVFGEII